MNEVHAWVLFVDVRGWTRWSASLAGSETVVDFITQFYRILRRNPPLWVKYLGDGAMMVREIEPPPSYAVLHDSLQQLLDRVLQTETAFTDLCGSFALSYGETTALRLGWGITRGVLYKIGEPDDYLGTHVNRAARLCGQARPSGIVLAQAACLELPDSLAPTLLPALVRLEGYESAVDVWRSSEVSIKAL